MSEVIAEENSDSSGYISRDSPTRTMAIPCALSVERFIRYSTQLVSAGSFARAQSRGGGHPSNLARKLDAPAIDPGLHRSFGQPETLRDFLVRQLVQVAHHDRRLERERQLVERLAEHFAQVALFELPERARVGGCGRELAGIDLARNRLTLFSHAPVMIDAQVPRDA